MDRETLVQRNKALAEAFHTPPLKHLLRRFILRAVGKIPFMPPLKITAHQRILLIRPDHLGDVLLTTPAIRALKQVQPHIELHALVGAWSADVLAQYPEIDQVLTLPFPGFTRSDNDDLSSPYRLAVSASRKIRRIGYDAAIIFRPDHWWGALTAHLAGIQQIMGYDLPDVAPFLTHKVKLQDEHVLLQNMRLVERWTGKLPRHAVQFSFPVSEADRLYIDEYLHERQIQDELIICIHPGSGTFTKRWRVDRWAQVADTLTDQLNATILFTGSPKEISLVKQITGQMQHDAVIAAGDTDASQLAALLQRANLVLGPDSGPMHLAAAVGTPTVTLFGPAKLSEFATWGSPEKHIVLASDILCLGCGILDWGSDPMEFHPCMTDISVGRVLEAARTLAQRYASPE